MKNLLRILVAAGILLVSAQAKALLTLTPSDCNEFVNCWTTIDTSNLSPAEVANLVGYVGTLEELYKSNVGGVDEKAFANSYDTTFSNSATDPANALIEYLAGMPAISCPDCYLLVKDGRKEPAQYVFDLDQFVAADPYSIDFDIQLEDFWLNCETDSTGQEVCSGAISHVSIYGGENGSVPEPGILALLATGLIGLVAARRFRS